MLATSPIDDTVHVLAYRSASMFRIVCELEYRPMVLRAEGQVNCVLCLASEGIAKRVDRSADAED